MAPRNVMKEYFRATPRHHVDIATSEQILNEYCEDLRGHGKKYTYFAIYVFHRNKKHFPRQLRERELHAREYTNQCHSFKFPLTTQHVQIVVHITYAAHVTHQKLTPPYEEILCATSFVHFHTTACI
jgi:hypothetical protein